MELDSAPFFKSNIIMASRKTIAAPEATQEEVKVEAPVVEAPEVEAPAPEVSVEVEAPAPEAKAEEKVPVAPTAPAAQELPDYAKKVLKTFSNMPELYISAKGGVFTKDTKPAIRGAAILYKNPYYKQ